MTRANWAMTGIAAALWALSLSGCDKTPAVPAAAPSRAAAPSAAAMPAGPAKTIVAIGDSLFAGYGLSPGQSYPDRLQAALRAQGVAATIVNAGVSGDTSGDIRRRLAFVLDAQPKAPDLLLIELGGNDLLRGLPPAQLRENLDAILTELDKRGAKVLVMGMLAPPNLGADYRAAFDPLYPALAKAHGDALVPFFLRAVMGKPALVQADHVHPTAQGVDAIVADTLPAVKAQLAR